VDQHAGGRVLPPSQRQRPDELHRSPSPVRGRRTRSTGTHTPTPTGRASGRLAAGIVAVAFLLVGVLGFVPGVTTHYDQLSFAGHDSMAMLLGVFMVSILHNVVHLVFGVAGLAAARTPRGAKLYLVVGGIVYLVLWLYGLLTARGLRPVAARD
jgi:hypothetical protein